MTDYLYEVDKTGIVFTALAGEIVSAGWLVKATSTAAGVTSLGLSSLAKGDIKIEEVANSLIITDFPANIQKVKK